MDDTTILLIKGMSRRIDRLEDDIREMKGMMKEMMNKLNNISSEKLNDDAVRSMREKFSTYDGPR